MSKGQAISVEQALKALTFLADRTPESTDEQKKDAFSKLSDYRNGGVFIGHYAGYSEWECHPHGDEIVMVLDGETTLCLLDDIHEQKHLLRAGELLVVPQDVWHRFETPKGVKVLTVTPQPTEHRRELSHVS